MNNSEFGFETQAIRNQLERTQYLEHSVPCISRLVLYLKMPKTCAFAEEKTGIFTADTATQITTNLLAKYALWKVLQLVLLCIRYGSGVFHFGCFIEFWRSHCFFEQCFGATHSLFINYFQNGTYKPRILTSINLRLLKV
jgi:O-succinylhomoserine sulfhydrylase